LPGSLAVVTGGSSGIGRASAVRFAETGAFVIVADTDEVGGRQTIEMIGDRGLFVKTDVTELRDVDRLFDAAVEMGPVTAVHNNAAVTMPDSQLHELSTDVWDRVFGTNLRGAWLILGASLRIMREQRSGAIVNSSSIAGSTPMAGRGPYCAAKAGLTMLTRVAALESGPFSVRVNAVAPGSIDTPMVSSRRSGAAAPPGGPSMGRIGRPEEVAAAVVWLCSDAASYVNGAIVAVDGGWVPTIPADRPIPVHRQVDEGSTN
jgi:NAD(P)-dependent dehydrogenase (short-subunit alcohol dehydrogenase family)